jgi:LCP family protein required for cell wall assembly
MLVFGNLIVFGVFFVVRGVTNQFLDSVTQNDAVVAELTPVEDGGAITFLVIGSDSRESLPEDFGDFGNFGGQRADVIMLVQLEGGSARILSLPRDLKVDVAGHGTQKVNAAYAFGGAPLMVSTVSNFTGIAINHYVEMDFFGFASIVDELGGVEVNFPYAARDQKSGLDVEAGRQTLNGSEALAYARSRKYQELRDGNWVSVAGSDLGRVGRQQVLVFAILSAAKRPSIVFDAPALIAAAGDHVTIDASLDRGRLVDLALAVRDLSPSDIAAATLPTSATTESGVYYLIADDPGAGEAIAAFNGGAELVAPSGPLAIKVLNGNGEKGQAGEWGEFLANSGFDVDSVGDADSYDFAITVITARPEGIERAQEIVDALGFGIVEPGTVPDGIDAVVIIGLDALNPA